MQKSASLLKRVNLTGNRIPGVYIWIIISIVCYTERITLQFCAQTNSLVVAAARRLIMNACFVLRPRHGAVVPVRSVTESGRLSAAAESTASVSLLVHKRHFGDRAALWVGSSGDGAKTGGTRGDEVSLRLWGTRWGSVGGKMAGREKELEKWNRESSGLVLSLLICQTAACAACVSVCVWREIKKEP